MTRFAMSFAAALLLVSPTLAEGEMDHMMMTAPDGASEATKGYVDAMNGMTMGMMMDYSGDADVDFIKGMIPHHQGAIDMAKVVLAHGADPEVRKLAEGIIAAQDSEIAWMNDWLAKHGQ